MSLYLGDQIISGQATLVGESRNIGQIIPSTIPLTDAGLHLLDGSLIQGSGIYSAFVTYIAGLVSTYPDLFITEANWQSAVSNYGVCGKFVYDSTNNTVRLPKITGIVEGTTDVTALGDLVQAGLPIHTHTRGTMNITGQVQGSTQQSTSTLAASGCFSQGSVSKQRAEAGNSDGYLLNFDASRNWTGSTSNPNYSNSSIQNSSTVQPQTIKVLYYIVVATSTKTDIEVDIDEIATDLNGKADVDLTNINNSGTSTGASWAMPSSTYKNLTLGASGTTYTAPANGFACVLLQFSSTSNSIQIRTETPGVPSSYIRSTVTGYIGAYIPLGKGMAFRVEYNGTISNSNFKFIYAKGSESEAS